MKIFLKITFFLLLFPLLANSHDFIPEVQKRKDLPSDTFLEAYPFADYIQSCTCDNLQELEEQRQYLNQLGLDGNAFIQKLFSEYMANTQIDFENMEQIKDLLFKGELLLNANQHISPDSSFFYMVAGDMVLSAITDSLEVSLNNGKVSKRNHNVQYIIEKLSESQFLVNVPVSNWEKVWMHFKDGNFSYIWDRATGTYRKESLKYLSICAIFLIPGGWFFIRRRKKKRTPSPLQETYSTFAESPERDSTPRE